MDIEKIIDSENLNDKLKNEVSYIYKEISRNKIDNDEIEFKEYSFDFDNNNQNKIKHIGNNNKKEKSIIIDENEDEDNKIFKKNNLNYIEVNLNNARSDRDNLINPFEEKYLNEISNEKILASDTNVLDKKLNENKQYEEKLIEDQPKEEKLSEKKTTEEKSNEEKLNKEENIKQEANDQEKEGNNNINLKNIKPENKISENSEIENNINNLNNKNSENEFSKLLNEQKKLNDKIKELENKLKEKDDLINDYIETINKLQKSLNENIHQNENLNEKLIRKSNEIKELKKEMDQLKIKMFKFPFELSEKEELVSIIITTIDESINISFLCKNKDKFIKIEKDFCNKYPQYKNLDNCFTINGKKIIPDLSLDENKIKNNDIVVLYQ